MDWRLGLLVHDAAGWPWVYIGAQRTQARTLSRHFVKCELDNRHTACLPPWSYMAVKRDTLVKKFPDLGKLWVEETMG